MGRTLATVTQQIHMQEDDWKLFRRTLRKEDKEVFDWLWSIVRYHSAPICMASSAIPLEAMFMAMFVGLAKRVKELEKGHGEGSNGDNQGMDI